MAGLKDIDELYKTTISKLPKADLLSEGGEWNESMFILKFGADSLEEERIKDPENVAKYIFRYCSNYFEKAKKDFSCDQHYRNIDVLRLPEFAIFTL